MKQEIFTKSFQKSLRDEGFPLEDIESDIAGIDGQKQKRNPIKVIRDWTGFSNREIREGFLNEERDVISPQVNDALLDLLTPWRKTKTDQGLPAFTVKEISRRTLLAPEKVIKILSQYPLSFSVNGSSFTALVQRPEFPNPRLTLSDCKKYGLSPIRMAKAARYLSRPPGGGPVQKAGIQDVNVDNLIRKRAWAEQRISFIKDIPEGEKI